MKQKFDLVISGLSLAGCYLALTAAENGKSVAVCDLHEFAGFDIAGTNELFCEVGSERYKYFKALNLPHTIIGNMAVASEGAVKKALAQQLYDKGVTVFYLSQPVAVKANGDGYTVTVAAKSTVFNITAASIVDATGRPLLASLLTKMPIESPEKEALSGVVVAGGVTDRTARALPELQGIKAELHPLEQGSRVYIKLGFCAEVSDNSVTRKADLTYCFLKAALKYFTYLRDSDEAFSKINLVSLGYDFIESDLSALTEEIGFLPKSATVAEVLKTASELKNLNTFDQADSEYAIKPIHEINARVAVAGMGTGGVSTVFGMMKNGINPLVCDIKPLPGGIHTVGMVTSFWHGYRDGFARKNIEDRDAFFKEKYPQVNIAPGFKEAVYQFLAIYESGCTVLTNSLCFAPILRGKTVKGFYAATEYGVVKITSDYTVDGTGDGDFAAQCDVPFTFGSRRDGMTQSFSMWGNHPDPSPSFFQMRYRGDFDVLIPFSYPDYLRALKIAQLNNSDYTVSPMLSYRESRHISSEYNLNLEDILKDTLFEDTLAVSSCPFDSHGHNDTELEPCGFINAAHPSHLLSLGQQAAEADDPNACELQIRIPLRCFLPKNIKRLATVGRALGATRDGANLVRMVADIENCGYAVGFAVSKAAIKNCEIGEVSADSYKEHFTEIGLLPDWAFKNICDVSVESLVERTAAGDLKAQLRLSACPKETAVPLLKQYDVNKHTLVLTSLAWFGDGSVTDSMIELARSVEGESNKLGYAVALLGRIGAESPTERGKIAEFLCDTADKFQTGGEFADPIEKPYYHSRVDCRHFKNNSELLAYCYAAERIGNKKLGEKLLELNSRYFGMSYCSTDENRLCFMAHTQLRIFAAAYRCGVENARPMLEEYLNDTHEIFRSFAKQELESSGILPIEFY